MSPAGLIVGLLLAGGQAPAPRPIALVGIRLIDGRGGPPTERATVIVVGDRIAAVGPTATIKVPAGARVIDGAGKSVLPGLADMHTHLLGGWDGETVDILGFRRTMGSLLYSGVTTVLDPGDVTSYVKQLHDEVAAGRLAGPRIYYAGPVFDGPRPAWPDISVAVSSAGQLPAFVAQVRAAGASFVKAYGGLSTEMVRALVAAAAKDSLRVIADVWQRNGTSPDAESGIAAFAHLGAAPMADSTIRSMAERGVASLTTLAVFESFTWRRFEDLRFIDDSLLGPVLPPSYRTGLRAHGAKAPADSLRARAMTRFTHAKDNAKRLHAAGVLLAAGTDAPYPGDFYGEGLHRELELLVEAGLSPLEAISAATRNAAQLLRAEREWGTIEVGKVADLLIVRGDPSRRIGDTRRIVSVLQRGRIVDRAGLRYDPRREPDYHPADLRVH